MGPKGIPKGSLEPLGAQDPSWGPLAKSRKPRNSTTVQHVLKFLEVSVQIRSKIASGASREGHLGALGASWRVLGGSWAVLSSSWVAQGPSQVGLRRLEVTGTRAT